MSCTFNLESWKHYSPSRTTVVLILVHSTPVLAPTSTHSKVMFIGTGAGKASLLPQLLSVGGDGALKSAGDSSPYPAARVAVGEGMKLAWCVDEAAASQCSPEIMALATKC